MHAHAKVCTQGFTSPLSTVTLTARNSKAPSGGRARRQGGWADEWAPSSRDTDEPRRPRAGFGTEGQGDGDPKVYHRSGHAALGNRAGTEAGMAQKIRKTQMLREDLQSKDPP